MEKLTITSSFNKSLEYLRTTDCSAKEKLHHFNNLSECLANIQQGSNSYQQFVRPTITVLVLFCEDGVDSTVRMCAHENLIKVLRICEAAQQTRKVLIDLYHEIKKNGNERSLRICLALFGHLIQHITPKRTRVYVQNLLPCLHAICGRRETMLLESLCEFMQPFCDHLALSTTEAEAMRLVDVFLDHLTVGCATKRRCMAQATMTVLERRHRGRHSLVAHTLARSTEVLVKNRDEVNTTLGVLGLWRLLVPLCLLELQEVDAQVQERLLEIFDLCIQYLLSCPNHSVINATLEVLVALTSTANDLPGWRSRLCNDPNELLSKRNSLKMVVCGKEAQLLSPEDTVVVSVDSSDQITLEMVDSLGDADQLPENVSLASLRSNDSSSISGFFHSLIPNTHEFFRSQRGSLFHDNATSSSSNRTSAQTTPIHQGHFVPPSPSQEAEVLNYTPASTKSGHSDWCAMEFRDCPVFGISDLNDRCESILSYSMRVLCSKYLLTGRHGQLVSDCEVRVSIKHLALVVLGNILSVAPQLFLQPLHLSAETESLDIDCERQAGQREEQQQQQETHLLAIKEDHFGPATASTLATDYLEPLSRSVDGSVAASGVFSLDPRMTHSDVAVSKAGGGSQVKLRVKRIKQLRESDQFIYEVLLLHTHSDPMLRSDVVYVVQSFFKGLLSCPGAPQTFAGFVHRWRVGREGGSGERLLQLPLLYDVIVRGLRDAHHAVVKHALSAIPMALHFMWQCTPAATGVDLMHQLLDETLNLAEGNQQPYWVTKSHLCEIVPKLVGVWKEVARVDDEVISQRAYHMLMHFLQDEDQRIRSAAAKGLVDWVALVDVTACDPPPDDREIVQRYVSDKVFADLAPPLNKVLCGSGVVCSNEDRLRQLLFDLSNLLLEVGEKHVTAGVIACLRLVMDTVPPVANYALWAPLNLLPVLESCLRDNALVLFDHTSHTECLRSYADLLAARGICQGVVAAEELQFLLDHCLQLMNIFAHVVNDAKPLVTQQGQKDLFMSDRDLQKVQMRGYFGHRPVYMRVYRALKATHDTYRIDMSAEVEHRLRSLLRAVTGALDVALELKAVTSMSQSTKLVEEVLAYLNALFVWEPVAVVHTAKFLFKYFFERNVVARREDYEYFRLRWQEATSVQALVAKIGEFHVMKPGEFYQEEESHIKLFEPIVIKSLRMYMKAEPQHQSDILDFICQLLTLNVNYAMLDANLDFFQFVQDQVDTIETGRVKDSELLIGNLMRFLFLLNNKKLVNNPKIIHMTDNLLANPHIRACGLRALVQLSEELFLARSSAESSAESSTEKEFVFSILMKFVGYEVVQRTVYLIVCTHARQEYRASTVEGVLAMVQRYQEEEEGQCLEMGRVMGLLVEVAWPVVVVGEDVLLTIDWTQVQRIVQAVHGDRGDMGTNWRILSMMIYMITNRAGKPWQTGEEEEFDWLGLLAAKWVEFHADCIARIGRGEVGDGDQLLKVYCDCKLPVGDRAFGDRLKEQAQGILTVKRLLSIRGRSAKLCLAMMADWVELGISDGYSEVLNELVGDSGTDRMMVRELVKTVLTQVSPANDQLDGVLVANVAIVASVIEESHKNILSSIADENLLKIVDLIYSGDISTSLQLDVAVLDRLEQVALGNLSLHESICECVHKYFGNSEKAALIKIRSKGLLLAISERTVTSQSTPIDHNNGPSDNTIDSQLAEKVDESWLWLQIKDSLSSTQPAGDCESHLEILLTMKSDSKVANTLAQIQLTPALYLAVFQCSFRHIGACFQRDCIAYNPHVNYLSVPYLMRHFMDQLLLSYATEDGLAKLRDSPVDLQWVTRLLSLFLSECQTLEGLALRSIEVRLWDKFVGEHLLKPTMIDFILRVLLVVADNTAIDDPLGQGQEQALDFIRISLGSSHIFRMWNRQEHYDQYFETFVAVINFTHRTVQHTMRHSAWMRDYQGVAGYFDEVHSDPVLLDMYTKVAFLIKLREELSSQSTAQLGVALSGLRQVVHHIVRFNQVYPMAVIPHKYLRTVCANLLLSDHLKCPVPMMSIGDLTDSDTLKEFVANVKEIGFTSRQQFEEYLMTLLVLLNTEFDEAEYDSQEQYVIRRTCFCSITELLVTIKECPRIGFATHTFGHTARHEPIPISYMVHLKKLHEVMHLIPGCSPFEAPNLERDASSSSAGSNCSSQTFGFVEGQFNLPTLWQALEVEEEKVAADGGASNPCLRNCAYNLEWFEVDYTSSVKMVLEISTQTCEVHGERYLSFLLPCMVRLTDLFVTRDQFKWLRDLVYRLHETVPHEDANCHQYLVYLMCKTNAVLVAPTSDVTHLAQTVLPGYLKSRSPGILTATLKGLLVLFESCVLHNSSIGGLNEELQQLRKVVMVYAERSLAEQSATVGLEYEEHSRVLWATVFYTLETTVKLVPDCPFMAKVVQHLNRVLRGTTNLPLFCTILNGIQRLILTNCVSPTDLDTFERIAMDVVKKGHEPFAMPALQLLVTCVYVGSVDQLERTQKANGVVQEDPDTMLRLMEKIDVLFAKVKVSPPATARVYGRVLSLLVRDLVPAKDVLTKAIKELITSQPHVAVVAQILHQVFRSAIDAAYLPLLQDWLVCSLNNFLTLHSPAKEIWCLTVIFTSASLNVHLLKTFPHLLRLEPQQQQAHGMDANYVDPRLQHLFVVATKDFYDKLSQPQKQLVVDSFSHSATQNTIIGLVGKGLKLNG